MACLHGHPPKPQLFSENSRITLPTARCMQGQCVAAKYAPTYVPNRISQLAIPTSFLALKNMQYYALYSILTLEIGALVLCVNTSNSGNCLCCNT